MLWEYKIIELQEQVHLGVTSETIERQLNELGKYGWEVIHSDTWRISNSGDWNYRFILRRNLLQEVTWKAVYKKYVSTPKRDTL